MSAGSSSAAARSAGPERRASVFHAEERMPPAPHHSAVGSSTNVPKA